MAKPTCRAVSLYGDAVYNDSIDLTRHTQIPMILEEHAFNPQFLTSTRRTTRLQSHVPINGRSMATLSYRFTIDGQDATVKSAISIKSSGYTTTIDQCHAVQTDHADLQLCMHLLNTICMLVIFVTANLLDLISNNKDIVLDNTHMTKYVYADHGQDLANWHMQLANVIRGLKRPHEEEEFQRIQRLRYQ